LAKNLSPTIFRNHIGWVCGHCSTILLGKFIILVSVEVSAQATMVSFNGRSWDYFHKATVENDPDFQEGVDIVGVSPFEN